MNVLKSALFASLFLLLAGTAGCSAFRAMFSRDPAPREERQEKRLRRKSGDPAVRDPIRDMFKIHDRPSYLNDKLTDQERAMLRDERDSNDLSVQRKRFKGDYESEKKKRRDWVFSR